MVGIVFEAQLKKVVGRIQKRTTMHVSNKISKISQCIMHVSLSSLRKPTKSEILITTY